MAFFVDGNILSFESIHCRTSSSLKKGKIKKISEEYTNHIPLSLSPALLEVATSDYRQTENETKQNHKTPEIRHDKNIDSRECAEQRYIVQRSAHKDKLYCGRQKAQRISEHPGPKLLIYTNLHHRLLALRCNFSSTIL